MRRSLALIFAITLMLGSETALAGPVFHYDVSGINLKARQIKFPGNGNSNFGALSFARTLDERSAADKSAFARGVVNIPAGYFTWLAANNQLYENPDVLAQIPPDTINKLSLTASSLEESGETLCDRAMKRVRHQQSIMALDLSKSDVSDSGVAYAAELKNLQTLVLFMDGLSGSFLKPLSRLKHFRKLDLRRNSITAENLRFISGSSSLEYLDVSQNGLNDASVRSLGGAVSLRCLILAGNHAVSDSGLLALRGLKNLRYLDLINTGATLRGVTALKGLPLKHIELSAGRCTKEEIAQAKKMFPGVELILAPGSRNVDNYTRDLFAPLH